MMDTKDDNTKTTQLLLPPPPAVATTTTKLQPGMYVRWHHDGQVHQGIVAWLPTKKGQKRIKIWEDGRKEPDWLVSPSSLTVLDQGKLRPVPPLPKRDMRGIEKGHVVAFDGNNSNKKVKGIVVFVGRKNFTVYAEDTKMVWKKVAPQFVTLLDDGKKQPIPSAYLETKKKKKQQQSPKKRPTTAATAAVTTPSENSWYVSYKVYDEYHERYYIQSRIVEAKDREDAKTQVMQAFASEYGSIGYSQDTLCAITIERFSVYLSKEQEKLNNTIAKLQQGWQEKWDKDICW